ncbi:DUF6708 domain-containing protein [Pseudomonas aeruginosa]|uniref:DUF6708 domain-containing protein n=1 Tax=Pseudomonas aeruginosa TaxID=287 RepID=UPI000A7B5015|nr:DUF6708 domain-containing protein [Pseudomonas aeruginosa]
MSKALLDKPTKGWKVDLPLPQISPDEELATIGFPPNFSNDIYLELHTSRVLNRLGVLFAAAIMFWCAFQAFKLVFFGMEAKFISAYPLVFLLMIAAMIGSPVAGIVMLRNGISSPRDEPIRFNRKRRKVYLYRFRHGHPLRRIGWGARPAVFSWEDLRAEAWSRMAPTTSGVPIFAWGVDVAVVEPGTNHVIDRFQLAGSNANGEHMWDMARAFMNQGPEALPKYPHPPRDWNNDVPWYNLALRLAPKVEWPADIDRESRTAP